MHGPTYIFWANLTPFSLRVTYHVGGMTLYTVTRSALQGRVLGDGDAAQAGLDEGIPALSLSNLVYMDNPYMYQECQ